MKTRHPLTRKLCLWCKEPFVAGPKARYCSDSCGGYYRRRQRGIPEKKGWWGTSEEARQAIQPYKDRGLSYQAAVRAWLADYKLAHGCADCGYHEHFAALQLDHEGEKSLSIADARTSVERLLEEIRNGECVVRCANCHAVKTWERKQR